MCRSTISFENAIAGFASIGRQTIISSRPRGLSAVAMLRMPAVGFWKNMVPKRAKATSNSPLKGTICASRAANSALSTPAAAASSRAMSRNGSQQSVPTTWPPGRMRSAICSVVSPKPQPMSSTRSPAFRPSRSSGPRLCASPIATNIERNRRNGSASTSFQNWMCSAFGDCDTDTCAS